MRNQLIAQGALDSVYLKWRINHGLIGRIVVIRYAKILIYDIFLLMAATGLPAAIGAACTPPRWLLNQHRLLTIYLKIMLCAARQRMEFRCRLSTIKNTM